jgi:hypothetical protein
MVKNSTVSLDGTKIVSILPNLIAERSVMMDVEHAELRQTIGDLLESSLPAQLIPAPA